MSKYKKGQEAPSGAAAGTLVGIITLLFIFYILFLPPAERESLLADENAPGTELAPEETLLQASVGNMEVVSEEKMQHYVPNMYLQELKSAQVFATINPFVIKKTLTGSETKNITFGLPDIAGVENVMLSFAVPRRQGTLRIKVNGYEIFAGAVTQQNPAPIPISKSYLQAINTVVFSVEGFGLPPKEYDFTDVKIIGDVIDALRMQAVETIPVSETEYNNLERAALRYYLSCDQLTVGVLEISLNEKTIFSGSPSCDSAGKLDLFQADILPGKNLLKFKVSKSGIGVEQMMLETSLKPTKVFGNFFTVSQSLYAAVKKGDRRVALYIDFSDDTTNKQLQTSINGRLDVIDQKTAKFERDISSAVVRGNNYIELTPMTELNIVKLEIRAE